MRGWKLRAAVELVDMMAGIVTGEGGKGEKPATHSWNRQDWGKAMESEHYC